MAFSLDLSGLSVFAGAAANSGSDLNSILEALDIQVSDVGVPFFQWPLSTISKLLEALEAGSKRQHFPFAFAEVFRFEGRSEVAAFVASAGSLREIRPLLDWMPDLIHPAIKMQYREDGNQAQMQVQIHDAGGEFGDMPVFAELIIAVTARLARQIAPDVITLKQVDFRHHARHALADYEQYFECPVRFQAESNQIIIDSRSLDAPLPGNMPGAYQQATESIRRNLLGDGVAPSCTLLVEGLLQEQLPLLGAGIEGVAGQLKLHPRTLQRQLSKEGHSYSELLARVRHRKASAMLRDTTLDIESIGVKLGFSDRRSFTQAFKHWQGQTPSQYRRQTRS